MISDGHGEVDYFRRHLLHSTFQKIGELGNNNMHKILYYKVVISCYWYINRSMPLYRFYSITLRNSLRYGYLVIIKRRSYIIIIITSPLLSETPLCLILPTSFTATLPAARKQITYIIIYKTAWLKHDDLSIFYLFFPWHHPI